MKKDALALISVSSPGMFWAPLRSDAFGRERFEEEECQKGPGETSTLSTA
jgi:hypothetical protein